MLDDSINIDDTFEDIKEYQININKSKYLNEIDNMNDNELKNIIKLHKDNHIYNINLLDKIETCFEKNILNYSIIEQITFGAKEASLENELIDNLYEFYDFLLEKKFEENDYKSIRKIIKKNIINIKQDLKNFYEIMLQMKNEIIIYKLKIKENYIKDLIKSCVEKKWLI